MAIDRGRNLAGVLFADLGAAQEERHALVRCLRHLRLATQHVEERGVVLRFRGQDLEGVEGVAVVRLHLEHVLEVGAREHGVAELVPRDLRDLQVTLHL